MPVQQGGREGRNKEKASGCKTWRLKKKKNRGDMGERYGEEEGQDREWRETLARRGKCQDIKPVVADTHGGSKGGKQDHAMSGVAGRRRGRMQS